MLFLSRLKYQSNIVSARILQMSAKKATFQSCCRYFSTIKRSNKFSTTLSISEFIKKYEHFSIEHKLNKEDKGSENERNDVVSTNTVSEMIAGRVTGIRTLSKNLTFLDLCSGGESVQIAFLIDKKSIKKPDFTQEQVKDIKRGDIIGLTGAAHRTKTGELSLLVKDMWLLSSFDNKDELPILNRENHDALKDHELRYTKRYLDLIVNNHHKTHFITRAKIVKFLRQYLEEKGFLEVETPMLSYKAGGAIAKPFVTHANFLKTDLYMRIAPELYLKQLIIAGFEKVFEIGKNFRNEQITVKHNPEFTTCEFYEAYSDYIKLMKMTQDFLKSLVFYLFQTYTIKLNGELVDFSKEMNVFDVFIEFENYFKLSLDRNNKENFTQQINHAYLSYTKEKNIQPCISDFEKKIEFLIEEIIEIKCNKPSFIIHHPIMLSPLSKHKDDEKLVSERFEFYINKIELINAYSELNDHKEQLLRLEEQSRKNNKDNDESHPVDLDFIEALSYGMPPTAGFGIGIDRLAMILQDLSNIKDVILFPMMNVNHNKK